MYWEGTALSHSYNRLLRLAIYKTQLSKAAKIASNAMTKIGREESVPFETILKNCALLNGTLDNIFEIMYCE